MDKISAIPMMPMDPAKDVRMVLAFFVLRLLKLRDREVKKDMEAFPMFRCSGFFSPASSTKNGSVSAWILPSRRRTILVA